MDKGSLYLSTIDSRAGELARAYGLGVEIAAFCTPWNLDVDLEKVDPQVRSAISGVPRRILHGPFNELHPCAVDPKARELARYRYSQAMELARDYGCKKVVFHGGFVPNAYYPSWYVQESVIFWRDFLGGVPQDIQIVLENVLEGEPEMLREVVCQVGDPRLRICLDVGHANVYSQVPVITWLETLGPWISHFHMHNNHGDWDSHSPLDQGSVPIRELIRRWEHLCPDATCTLELTMSESSVIALLEE